MRSTPAPVLTGVGFAKVQLRLAPFSIIARLAFTDVLVKAILTGSTVETGVPCTLVHI